MKTFIISLIFSGIFFLTGCLDGNNTVPDNLTGSKWILIKILHTDTKIEEPVPGNLANMNIEFIDSYKIQGLGACNSIMGDYSIFGDDSIKVNNLGRTKMYCGNETDMTWEDNFYSSLKNAQSFVITEESLIIKSASNVELIFKPKE